MAMEEFETKKEILATKKDIFELSEATKKDISELSERISEKMSSHFKWLIGMFITQMAFILGLVYFILNYSK